MYPKIHLIGKEFPTYGLIALVGILLFGTYVISNGKKNKFDEVDLIKCLIISALGSFIGAHLLYFVTKIKDFIYVLKNLSLIKSFKQVIEVFNYLYGGWVFYGGLIGGIVALIVYLKIHNKKVLPYINLCAPAVPLFHFFGRVGCFFAGCCYGIESKFGITFHHSEIPYANGVKRFPIQLVEAFFCLLLFFFLDFIFRKTKYNNITAYLYLIIYPIGRFIIEFFRGDEYRGFLWKLSTSQWISIIILMIGVIGIIKTKKRESA